MKRKKFAILLRSNLLVFLLVATLVTWAAAPKPVEAKKMTLRMGGIHPERSMVTQALFKKFLDLVTEKTNGRITFKTYWGASLVKSGELLEATSKGIVDMANGLWIFEPGRVPLGSLALSFLFNEPDYRIQAKVQREIYERIPAMNQELAAVGLGPALFFGSLPSYDILSKTPIKTLEDLKGLKVGHSPTEYVSAFEAIGAISVISPAPKFYERLERGVIDAAFLPITIYDIYKVQEVAPYHTTVNFNTPVIFTLWTNLDMWNSLTPQDQKIFREAGKEAEAFFIAQLDKDIERIKQSWAKQGVTFFTMPDAETKKWTSAMPDVAANWAEKMESQGKPGREIIKLYRKLGGTEH
jgi:TRAP-type C4-dicarboxylate transport system substrate-binding protein